MKKKILIIGAEGYKGKVVSNYLSQKKYQINAIDNFTYGTRHFLKQKKNKNYKLFKGSMSDLNLLKKASKDIDVVVMLAGLVGDPITKKYFKKAKKANEEYVDKVISFFSKNKVEKFIFISTCSNYGLVKHGNLLSENYPLSPKSHYAKSKVKIEKRLLSLKTKNMNSIILRFATAFGMSQRMRFDLTINEFVRDLLFFKKLTVYDANTWRPYCHVKDFARAIHKIILTDVNKVRNQVFNVGDSSNNFTKKMIVNKITKKLKNNKVEFLKNSVDPRNYKVNFSKINSVLKFKCKYSVNFGINEIIKYLKNNKSLIKKTKEMGNYKIK